LLLRSGGITEEDLGIERILEEVGWNFGGVLRLGWKVLGGLEVCGRGNTLAWRAWGQKALPGVLGGLRQSICPLENGRRELHSF
jgi:hypothetical protein